jgi:hypothetical protein
MKSRGRDQFQDEPVFVLMPDERREIRLKRPASHTTLDGVIVIARGWGKVQGNVYKFEAGWRGFGTEFKRPLTETRASREEPVPMTSAAE